MVVYNYLEALDQKEIQALLHLYLSLYQHIQWSRHTSKNSDKIEEGILMKHKLHILYSQIEKYHYKYQDVVHPRLDNRHQHQHLLLLY